MARTTQEIYEEMLRLKTENGLPTNNSPMSMINRLMFVWAFALSSFENILDIFKNINDLLSVQSAYGSLEWFKRKIVEFQVDSTLDFFPKDNTIRYTQVDPSRRIITAYGIEVQGRTNFIKVAKGVAGGRFPLAPVEQVQFQNYLNQITPLGQNNQVLSIEGDDILIMMQLKTNSQFDFNVDFNQKVNDYLYSIEMGGIVQKNKIVDQFQVRGVDAVITNKVTFADFPSNYLNPTIMTDLAGGIDNGFYILKSGYIRNITLTVQFI